MSGTSDILGHAPIIERLWNRLRQGRAHHAYLFEGPEGVGKRTVALRYAQAANCTAPGASPADLPCGTCASCVQIARGHHPDVLRIEPDPDRKTPIITVDQIRELIRQTGYHRFGGRRRVIVIDPAEALPPPAANALLKVLEEPPDGTGFILLATHAATLLPTILSRCQRVRFSAVPVADLAAWLQAGGHDHPDIRAKLSMGRPGVALDLSEQAVAERKALQDQIFRAAGSGDLGQIHDLSKSLCEGGRAAWRPRVEQVFELIEDLLRDACVIGAGAQTPLLDDARLAERAADRLWPSGITAMHRALDEARAALAVNATGRTVMDALLTRLATELGKV